MRTLRLLFSPLGIILSVLLLSEGHSITASAAEKDESLMIGPSFQLGLGARFRKAPELDRYDSPTIGLKASLFGFRSSSHSYVTLLGLGVNYVGDNRVAFSVTPLGFFHHVGVGLAFDLYSTRSDRTGGPYGVSLNFDLLQITRTVMDFAGR